MDCGMSGGSKERTGGKEEKGHVEGTFNTSLGGLGNPRGSDQESLQGGSQAVHSFTRIAPHFHGKEGNGNRGKGESEVEVRQSAPRGSCSDSRAGLLDQVLQGGRGSGCNRRETVAQSWKRKLEQRLPKSRRPEPSGWKGVQGGRMAGTTNRGEAVEEVAPSSDSETRTQDMTPAVPSPERRTLNIRGKKIV